MDSADSHTPQPTVPVSGPPPNYNPIATGNHAAPATDFNEDAELDNILTDVNHEVRANLTPAQKVKGPGLVARSVAQARKIAPAAPKTKKSRPKLVIVVAVVVAILLMAAAVYDFKQTQTSAKVAEAHLASVQHAQAQAAAGSSMDTFDLDYLTNFSNSLSNDKSQDFDPSSVSDSSLGL